MAIDEGITLRELEASQSLMTLGNMNHVSEVLRQGTVGVHRMLRSPEEGLRCPLFKCDGHKLISLSIVHVFAKHAEQILAECETGMCRTCEAAGFSSTTLKVDGLYSMTVGTLPCISADLKIRRSMPDIGLTSDPNRSLLVKLENDQFNTIVIILGKPPRNPDPLAVPMFDNGILSAAPLGSPYASSAGINLQTVCSEEFVALGNDFATYHDFMAAFNKAGFVPQTALCAGDILLLMNLVGGGIGYALLPHRVADFNPKVQPILLAARYAISQHTVLVMQRNQERDPNLPALSTECRLLDMR